MSESLEERCPECVWSRVIANGVDERPRLECWRYPPTMVWVGDQIVRVRAQVDEDEYCGEFDMMEVPSPCPSVNE